MSDKTNKSIKDTYKNDLTLENSSYTGVSSSVVAVQDGAGGQTAAALSDRSLHVDPSTDNNQVFVVKDQGGSAILTVDTSSDPAKVLVNESQVNAQTHYAYFGIDSGHSTGYSADTHYAIPFGFLGQSAELATLGSSTSSSFNDTDPASSLTMTTNSYLYTTTMWYVPDAVVIDGVYWFCSADQDDGDDVAAHLMSYAIDQSNGSSGGNLSAGEVLADGTTITNAGQEQTYYQSMTIRTSKVSAGKVIMFVFASDTVNSDYSINATVKYHIQ